jgi:hypothetical protein
LLGDISATSLIDTRQASYDGLKRVVCVGVMIVGVLDDIVQGIGRTGNDVEEPIEEARFVRSFLY